MSAGPGELLVRLAGQDSYRAKLDQLLAIAGEIAGAPDRYLYVLEPGGLRFHLEHSSARPAEPASRSEPAAMHRVVEGGAEWSLPTPSFELVRTPQDEQPRKVSTPIGPLWSLPLPDPRGDLLALIQLGPAAERTLSRRARSRLEQLTPALAQAVALVRREEQLRRRLAAAEAQLEASRRLGGSTMDVGQLVALLLELALRSTSIPAGFVAIAGEGGHLQIRAASGLPAGFAQGVDLSPERGLLDWSLASGGALFLRDPEAAQQLGISSLLAVPLLEQGSPLGVFALLSFEGGDALDPAGLDLLEAFSEQIRLMLSNERVFATFSERYLETLRGLARALDARRPETHGHHDAVARCAVAIARELVVQGGSLDESAIESIALAGELHDIGLAGAISGSWDANVEHPAVGASLIAQLPIAPAVARAIAAHHEWFDGWGFPVGLSGEAILIEGRVLALAEFLVEMASTDQARAGLPPQALLSLVEQRRGSQFDPHVARAAAALLESGRMNAAPDAEP